MYAELRRKADWRDNGVKSGFFLFLLGRFFQSTQFSTDES